jgi:hypothetical protein
LPLTALFPVLGLGLLLAGIAGVVLFRQTLLSSAP